MILEFTGDQKLIEKNPFETAKVKQLHILPFGGIEKDSYGGKIYRIAELYNGLFLAVGNDLKTIDVAKIKKEEVEI